MYIVLEKDELLKLIYQHVKHETGLDFSIDQISFVDPLCDPHEVIDDVRASIELPEKEKENA